MYRRLFVVLIAALSIASGSLFARSKSDAPKDGSVVPKDAHWTLYCRAVAGPDHVAEANSVKEQLLSLKNGLKDWYIIHEAEQSVIYFGYYRSIDDPKDKAEGDRAKADRTAVQGLKDSQGNRIFANAIFVEMAAPDPEAPPEWDLRNAKGFWSVEVGVYKDSPQRKQAAVDSVREARKRGEEAYYYHGPTASSVCIGVWPREAVREQESDDEVFSDPTRDILVLPGLIDASHIDVRNRNGDPVETVAPKTEIVDPSLIATMRKYPSRALNGEDYVKTTVDPVTHEEKHERQPSQLIMIPQSEPSLLRESAPPPTLVAPDTPSQAPGAGTLKSLGQ